MLALGEHRLVIAEAAAMGLRQIDPPPGPVQGHVLAEVGQLQPGADRVGQPRPGLIVASPEVKDQAADGVGRVAAIVEHLVGRLVAIDLLVLPEGRQEIDERVGRDRELADRLGQGDEHRMARLALVAFAKLTLPPVQQGQALPGIAGLVGQVVGPAAVGVDVVEVLPQLAGEQQAGDGEVLVMPLGQPPAIAPGLAERRAFGRAGLRPKTLQIGGKRDFGHERGRRVQGSGFRV